MPPEGELRAAIVQDAESGRVLMLAWMDAEAERRTRESGEATFWSRSRQEYWRKGETSGNTLAVEEIRDDCDGDALLLRVRPAGPACHTGSFSCFAPARAFPRSPARSARRRSRS
jgi:phosphoribosyl-AMP cyclohydrolase